MKYITINKDGLSGDDLAAIEKLEKNMTVPMLDEDNPEGLPNLIKDLRMRIDDVDAAGARISGASASNKMEDQIASSIGSNHENILAVKNGEQSKVQFKALPMLSDTHLTGDGINTYGKMVLNVGTTLHARDIVPMVKSDTATWIDYVEGATTGAVAFQTEGAAKAQLEFVYEPKSVKGEFLAGWTRFSKQLASNIPFLKSVLAQQLAREFYKAEDTYISTGLSTNATGYASAATDDIEAIIDTIAGRLTAGYETDAVLLNHKQYARLLKTMFTSGNYYGSGSVVGTPGGSIAIWSTPIIPVAWVADDKGLFIDRSFVNRVVVAPMNIQFSDHDQDNFTKNLITARIEEQEALSVLKTDAISFIDFGNVS